MCGEGPTEEISFAFGRFLKIASDDADVTFCGRVSQLNSGDRFLFFEYGEPHCWNSQLVSEIEHSSFRVSFLALRLCGSGIVIEARKYRSRIEYLMLTNNIIVFDLFDGAIQSPISYVPQLLYFV